AGMVYSTVNINNDRVESVTFENVPGFLEKKDLIVNTEEIGDVTVDISFGGNYFAWADINQFNEEIKSSNGTKLKELATIIKENINKQYKVEHPTNSFINSIDIVSFYGPPTLSNATYKNVHIFSNKQAD